MAQIVVFKRAHFFSLDNDIIDVHAKTIGAIGLAVYTVLARHANRQTGECWPSIGRLASLLGVVRNTIKAALRTLEAAGLITIKRRRDPAGDCTSHLFTLLDASPAAVEARLAKRRAAVTTPEGGGSAGDPPPGTGDRSAADLPPVSSCPTGGSPDDQEPDSSPLTKAENQPEGARAADETPNTSATTSCPHPLEERSVFGDIAVCQHCWAMLDARSSAIQGVETDEEGSAPDAHAA